MSAARLSQKSLDVVIRGGLGMERKTRLVEGLYCNRHPLQVNIPGFAFAQQLRDSLFGSSRRGDKDLFDTLLDDDLREQTISTKDPQTVSQCSLLLWIDSYDTHLRVQPF